MLSKGLLPLKRVVLFLAMSLPVQCMSFLWSWSSIRSASSPVHQNKYLCCSHEMVELMWLEAGLWEQARPSDSAVSAETAHLSCFMGCLGLVIPGGSSCVRNYGQFWNKNHLKLSQELGWWKVLPCPKTICWMISRCSCLLWWGQSPAAVLWLFACCPGTEEEQSPRRSSPRGSAVSPSPGPPACRNSWVQGRHGSSALAGTASTWVSFVLFSMPGFG